MKGLALGLSAVFLALGWAPRARGLADDRVRVALLEGRAAISFDPKATASDRTIPAEWLVAGLRVQDGATLTLDNAIVAEPVTLQKAMITRTVIIQHCRFCSDTDFDDSEFAGIFDCEECEFDRNAEFWGTRFMREARFDRSRFLGGLRMIRVRFDRDADFYKCVCAPLPATFNSFQCGIWSGNLSHWRGISMSDFQAARIDLEGAEVDGEWKLVNGRIAGQVGLDAGNFKGPARIETTKIGGSLMATVGSALWEGKPASRPAVFHGPVVLRGLQVEGDADFGGATFDDGFDLRNSGFSGSFRLQVRDQWPCVVTGRLLADGVTFEGPLDLNGLQEKGSAAFVFCRFRDRVDLGPARGDPRAAGFASGDFDFFNSEFSGAILLAYFHFGSWMRFDRAVIHSTLDLSPARYSGAVSLREAEIDAIRLPDGPDRPKRILLAGCRYARIEGNIPQLVDDLQASGSADSDALLNLEQRVRQQGSADDADRVRRKRMGGECRQAFGQLHLGAGLGYCLYFLLADYGTEPLLPLFYSAALVALGAAFFRRQGTAVRKPGRAGEDPIPVQLSCSQAFGFSLRLFLPVDIPYGSQWDVADSRRTGRSLGAIANPMVFATVCLRIPGWIVVPFAAALFTGILKVT